MLTNPASSTLTSWIAHILLINWLKFRWLGNWTSHLGSVNIHGSDWANIPWFLSLRESKLLSQTLWILRRMIVLAINLLALRFTWWKWLSIFSWSPLRTSRNSMLKLWHLLMCSKLLDRLSLELNWCCRFVFKLGCEELFFLLHLFYLLLFFNHLRSNSLFYLLLIRHISELEMDASYLLIIETEWWSANQVLKDSHLVN